jgi:hypothetical protein
MQDFRNEALGKIKSAYIAQAKDRCILLMISLLKINVVGGEGGRRVRGLSICHKDYYLS